MLSMPPLPEPEVDLLVRLFLHLGAKVKQGVDSSLGADAQPKDAFEDWLTYNAPSRRYRNSTASGIEEATGRGSDGIVVFDDVLSQSQNEHPDVVLRQGSTIPGLELKSLKSTLRAPDDPSRSPCRRTFDMNSTIPCGYERCKSKENMYNGRKLRTYYAFCLYGPETQGRPIWSLLFLDGNYLNHDYELHLGHLNVSERGFGSYGDAQVRVRKMYVFPNPLVDPDLRLQVRLLAGAGLERTYPLTPVAAKTKTDKQGKPHEFVIYDIA